MPTCQYELFAISYRWSVSNPKVKFDTTQIAKDSYTVEPYALPGKHAMEAHSSRTKAVIYC